MRPGLYESFSRFHFFVYLEVSRDSVQKFSFVVYYTSLAGICTNVWTTYFGKITEKPSMTYKASVSSDFQNYMFIFVTVAQKEVTDVNLLQQPC